MKIFSVLSGEKTNPNKANIERSNLCQKIATAFGLAMTDSINLIKQSQFAGGANWLKSLIERILCQYFALEGSKNKAKYSGL